MVYTFNTFFMDSLHKLYWVQNSEKQHISYISSKTFILDIMLFIIGIGCWLLILDIKLMITS